MKWIYWFQVIPLELRLIFFHSGITCILNFEPEKFAVISIPSRDSKRKFHMGTLRFHSGIPHGDSKLLWSRPQMSPLSRENYNEVDLNKESFEYKEFHIGIPQGFQIKILHQCQMMKLVNPIYIYIMLSK